MSVSACPANTITKKPTVKVKVKVAKTPATKQNIASQSLSDDGLAIAPSTPIKRISSSPCRSPRAPAVPESLPMSPAPSTFSPADTIVEQLALLVKQQTRRANAPTVRNGVAVWGFDEHAWIEPPVVKSKFGQAPSRYVKLRIEVSCWLAKRRN